MQQDSDDTAVLGCASSKQEAEYKELAGYFAARCGNHQLNLTMMKIGKLDSGFQDDEKETEHYFQSVWWFSELEGITVAW